MLDSAAPNAGIELDIIDLSQLNQLPGSKDKPKTSSFPTNYKDFVKDILKQCLANNSFLSFSVQIGEVNTILQMKYSSANDIAAVILKDVALTTKLLKLVNSSFYGNFSNKGISTISEAMILLGTEEIKLAAANLKIFELMQNISNIKVLKEKALKAMQRSIMARQIAIDEKVTDTETIQISAMLYEFGEYLVALFSPAVFIKVEILIDEKGLTRDEASRTVTGISYSALGRFVVSKWNLPESVINVMKPITISGAKQKNLSSEEYQRVICAFSNELCNIDFSKIGKQAGKKIVKLSAGYKQYLNIAPEKSISLLNKSWSKIKKYAEILKIDN